MAVKRSSVINWSKVMENKESPEYKRDKRFFILLYLGLVLYFVAFAVTAHYVGPKVDEPVREELQTQQTQDTNQKSAAEVVKEAEVDQAEMEAIQDTYHPLERNTEVSGEDVVWNPYRGIHTTQELLDADAAWANSQGGQ